MLAASQFDPSFINFQKLTMGLFDLFKPKSRNDLPVDNESLDDMIKKDKEELKKLQAENKLWEQDFKTTIKFRNTASDLEKTGKLLEAIEEYSKSISFGENSQRLNLNNYAFDIERLIILYGKTKQANTLIIFLETIISKYPNYRDTKKWAVRLSALTKNKSENVDISPNDITQQSPSNPTLGKQLQKLKDSFPKFNFYYDLPEGMNTLEYLSLKKPHSPEKSSQLAKCKEAFEIILSKAKIAENENNFKTAIEAYQKLISEEYEDITPFERLIVIYKKLRWTDHEIETIKKGIDFFSQLKDNQKIKALSLAKEFNMEDKANEYIQNNKKIFHYGGAFELYKPYPIIDKWKDKLSKLVQQNKKLNK